MPWGALSGQAAMLGGTRPWQNNGGLAHATWLHGGKEPTRNGIDVARELGEGEAPGLEEERLSRTILG